MKNNSEKRGIFQFNNSGGGIQWSTIILDRGLLINFSMLILGVICIVALFYVWSFKNLRELIFFKLIFSILAIASLWQYLNIVLEVRTDVEFIYIRKLRNFKKIPWNSMKNIHASTASTLGITFLWIRKKGLWGFQRNLYLFWTFEKERHHLLLSLLSEVREKVPVTYKI